MKLDCHHILLSPSVWDEQRAAVKYTLLMNSGGDINDQYFAVL